MCAAGPPNAVVPRRKNETAISRNAADSAIMRRKAMIPRRKNEIAIPSKVSSCAIMREKSGAGCPAV
jgi:hypothetical protein